MLRLLAGFLRPRSRSVVLVSALALAVAHGCLPSSDCERLRSCAPSGGTPGIVEQWSGGRGPLGGGEGGAAGEGGMGGLGAWGGMLPEVPPVAPGDECAPNGLYACASHATPDQLVCANGYFIDYGRCPSGQYCDTRPATNGLCQPVIPECEGHLPSDIVCRGTERLICGPDLVTTESLGTCEDLCWEGKCVECSPEAPPTCEFNSLRTCSADGHWQVEPCDTDTPHCSDGECGVPPSCLDLEPTCGIDEDEACCASPVVTGDAFNLNNNPATVATVSTFRLDRFEVTVGRFRAFKAAWDGGWRPEEGGGKHSHLYGGLGLKNANGGGHELGWQTNYSSVVEVSDLTLAGEDSVPDPYATWTALEGDNEQKPITFVLPVEAFAFCVWDGGFLPSEAEWSLAALGGGEAQRMYPWGSDDPENDFELAVHGCFFPSSDACVGHQNIAPVGTAQGISAFGQFDLGGNVAEQVLGSNATMGICDNCANTGALGTGGSSVRARGGDFSSSAAALENTAFASTSTRSATVGIRCGRVP